MEQKEPKKRKRKIVMNNVSDIEKRCAEVEPMSLFGASAMTFPDKISTTRSGMAVRHTGQYVVLSNPEFPRMYTGAENEFGERSSWNIKVHADHQLMKTFIKFKDYPDISPVCYILKDLSTGKFKCIVHEPAHHLVERYGFKMYNKIAGKYSEGDVIPADTPVSQSSSYVNGNYCSGRNIRLAYAVLPELTEDALIISDYAAMVKSINHSPISVNRYRTMYCVPYVRTRMYLHVQKPQFRISMIRRISHPVQLWILISSQIRM